MNFERCSICKAWGWLESHKCLPKYKVMALSGDDPPTGDFEPYDYVHDVYEDGLQEAAQKSKESDNEWYEVEEELFVCILASDINGKIWPRGKYATVEVSFEMVPEFSTQIVGQDDVKRN